MGAVLVLLIVLIFVIVESISVAADVRSIGAFVIAIFITAGIDRGEDVIVFVDVCGFRVRTAG